MSTTTQQFDAVSRLVDKVFTPYEGVKSPKAMADVEWMIACNQTPQKYTPPDEQWQIHCYLHSVRDDLIARGEKPVFESLLLSTEVIAARFSN